MKTTFDTDSILYNILLNSPLKNAISGGFYLGEDRPDDSEEEDVVINSIVLSQDYHPQIGTSNVNIYAPDKKVRIKGKEQMASARSRLKILSEKAIRIIKEAKIQGLAFTIESQTILPEPSVRQHFVNIRISWNIQTD